MTHFHPLRASIAAVVTFAAALQISGTGPSFAQNVPDAPDAPDSSPFNDPLFSEMIDQIRQGMDQLQQSGADSQQILQQMILQNLHDGDLDRDAFQQQMVDLGLLNQDLVDRIAASRKTRFIDDFHRQLSCPDDEWAVLRPRIDALITAQVDVEIADKQGLAGTVGPNVGSPMTNAHQALQAALADPHAGESQLANLVTQWRVEHQKAKAKLAAARQDLTHLLTLRQEALLATAGIL